MAQDKNKPRRNTDDLVDWFTVSYRSIYIGVFAALTLAVAFGYWYFRVSQPVTPTGIEASRATLAPTAGFAFLEGSVLVKKAGRLEWLAANKDMTLHEGDLVRTGGGSGAEIRFTSGTTFNMRADSLITIEKSSADPDSKRESVTALALQSGEVNFNTGGASTSIQTPVSRTLAGRNAEGGVTVSQSGESITRIYRQGEGTSVETRGGQKVALNTNQGVRVDAAGKAGEKLSLPPEPVLMAPPHETEISYANPAVATTLLAWKAAANAVTYHVLVDFTANFTRPLVDQKGWKPTSMELRGFDVGKYYWKVAAVDASGLEGRFSDIARFSVTRPGPTGDSTAPRLTIESLEPSSNILHVKGHTDPGSSLTVNDQRVDVQTDGTFNEFITLEKPGKQTVVFRATSTGGGVTKIEKSVAVAY